MTARVLDGYDRFGCSLADFYQQRELASRLARLGLAMPLTDRVATDAPPALAYINSLWPVEHVARWLARCPDCPVGDAYVWLSGPLIMLCVYCGNATIDGAFRPVELPRDWRQIEALLLDRPSPANWHWAPDETLDDIRAGTAVLRGE